MRKLLILILGVGIVVGLVLICINILHKTSTSDSKKDDKAKSASKPNDTSSVRSKLDEIAEKKAGLSGPFSVDDKVPESARNIGLLMNAWREAIVLKSIKDIEQISVDIGRYGKESIPFMRKLALEDQNERVRAFATRFLGRMRNADLTTFFIDLLKSDNSPFVREDAAWALGLLGDSRAL